MKEPKDAGKATLDSPTLMTGRDGAIDLAAKTNALDSSQAHAAEQNERFSRVMGAAVIALWGELPQPIQEQLFECAVVLGHQDERDEMLREQLAKFLHVHHERTRPSE
ncbi:MAG TPA: hypothetical protein VIH98_05845 [Xanthobacteraceae bacterium]